jgi:DNA-directed RNA polymerase subunit M/transcription elongation factor TFIIS
MSKAKFYQAVLVEVEGNIINHVYPHLEEGVVTLEERLPDDALCPECDNSKREWYLLPKESIQVKEGGKPYCECMNCGYTTHL